MIVEDRVTFDPDRNLFVWAGAGAELSYDECEALGLDGTGRCVTSEGRHAVRAVRYRDIEITEARGINSPTGRYLIERAQSAYDVLGAEFAGGVLGPGGLSGATAEQLERLIDGQGQWTRQAAGLFHAAVVDHRHGDGELRDEVLPRRAVLQSRAEGLVADHDLNVHAVLLPVGRLTCLVGALGSSPELAGVLRAERLCALIGFAR